MNPNFSYHIVAASAFVQNDAGDILLVKTHRRGWELPGGQVENGEDVLAAAERETREESGILVQAHTLIGVYNNLARSIMVMLFQADMIGGALRISDETSEVGWFGREAALSSVTHAVNHARLLDALNFNGKVIHRAYTQKPYTVISETTI